MPITASAKKSLRVAERRATENVRLKLRVKNQLKNISAENLAAAYRILDKAAKNNIMHPNKAARLKSRLSKRASVASEVAKEKPAKPGKAKTTRTTRSKKPKSNS